MRQASVKQCSSKHIPSIPSFICGGAGRAAVVQPGPEKAQGLLQSAWLLDGRKPGSFYSVTPTDWTGGSGHKLRLRKLHLSARKHFFLLCRWSHRCRLLMEAMDLPPGRYLPTGVAPQPGIAGLAWGGCGAPGVPAPQSCSTSVVESPCVCSCMPVKGWPS